MKNRKIDCESKGIKKWLGISAHKWNREGFTYRECNECGLSQRLINFDGFSTTWKDMN